jgi:hypothetical protein
MAQPTTDSVMPKVEVVGCPAGKAAGLETAAASLGVAPAEAGLASALAPIVTPLPLELRMEVLTMVCKFAAPATAAEVLKIVMPAAGPGAAGANAIAERPAPLRGVVLTLNHPAPLLSETLAAGLAAAGNRADIDAVLFAEADALMRAVGARGNLPLAQAVVERFEDLCMRLNKHLYLTWGSVMHGIIDSACDGEHLAIAEWVIARYGIAT